MGGPGKLHRRSAHVLATIYKICPRAAWDAATARGSYDGSPDDLRDGYIHFSTREQLPGTLAKYYRGERDLVLIAFDADELGAGLKWEPARGGQLFPHLFASLPTAAAAAVHELPLDPDGAHVLPKDLA